MDTAMRDLPLALGFAAASFVPAFHSHGTQLGGLPDRSFDALAAAAVALQCLPLALRRRWPLLCLALASLGFAADQLRGYHSLAGTGWAIALLSAGAHLERLRRTTVLLLSAAYVPLAVALHQLGGTEALSGYVTFYLATVLVWGIGAWVRSSRVAEAERRRRVAADTRAAERARIARELHDVVTHHVTAMVVQAEAARYVTAAPERLDQTLTTVTDTGRRALTDLRHLLDVLSPDEVLGPDGGAGSQAPPSGGLLALVEQTRRAGQPVEFAEEGSPAQPAGSAGLVAYRVVQEALTNALKYAHGSSTSVQVRYGAQHIAVEVCTDGSGAPTRSPGGSGRGLAGLRERVVGLGGDLSAGPGTGGGFVVRARIPEEDPT
ncbi:two-component sensor histidine kinase [Streptomyces sp. SB3404]|uniref:histidine kinase n=2 Tax=Streptomyces boncukensis TaxID=2711219 RepID=A0A6G4X9N7_9ACTN|nr:sensor histidine kinase [Streptomyces boncukensis]NGO73464.1 two-component sensor histidine kinase [Streptomyces boncukensis]